MKKAILTTTAVFVALIALLFGGISCRTVYAKTEIINTASEDGNYSLIIYMIGEPDWPFGATHCRFDLINGDKRIIKHSFDIRDDGAVARKSNFDITWSEDSVTVRVSGSEQEPVLYRLSFDGNVDYRKEEETESDETETLGDAGVTGATETAVSQRAVNEYPMMIMVMGELYYDCKEVSTKANYEAPDGTIDKLAKEVPVENNQSNFGVGYGYQYGAESGTVEVCINGEWHIFKKYEHGISKIVDEYLSLYYLD